jgi:uncharacterized membrane protein YsdA (DUF1294 family)
MKIRTFSIALATVFMAALGALVLADRLPLFVIVTYAAMSLVTFIAYWLDKRAAVSNARRTPENTLHLLALACGWPGGLVAQQWLRHKTLKVPFRYVLWATVLLNAGVLVWFISANW